MTTEYQVLLMALFILLSGFFSASETAFSTLNRIHLKSMVNGGDKRAKMTLDLAEDFDRLLSTILIGNNIVNIACASISVIVFTGLFGEAGISLSTGVVTVVVLIFGEISPKILAKANSESFAMSSAPILRFFVFLLTPVNFLFVLWKKLLGHIFKRKDEAKLTQDELMTYVDEAQNDGGIDERNGELIRSAIEFNDLEANDILTPRVNIVAIERKTSMDEITNIFLHSNYSRLPVYENSIDNIVGMIHEKDYFRALCGGETGIGSIIKKVSCVGTAMKISDLLRLLQQSKTHMAVVVDEFGGTAGIITMEDILEELVGDIWDEHDEVIEYFKQVGENSYEISCSAGLDDMFEYFNLVGDEEESDAVTVGGWVMEQLGKIPAAGDSFTFQDNLITVVKAAARHAILIRMDRPPQKDEEKEE